MSLFVLDCGIGNVGSIRSMYRRLGLYAELIDRPRRLSPGDRLILPGVGAFDAGVEAIERRDFRGFLIDAAAGGYPILGICLGMQLLCLGSEEGRGKGLGLIPSDVVHLHPGEERVRIPHMGWNIVEPVRDNPLLQGGGDEQRFYFAHSFCVPDGGKHVCATTRHGTRFASAVARGNVMGVQFHPEKSHRFGKALLARFAEAVDA